MQIDIGPETPLVLYTHLKLAARAKRFPVGNFLVRMALVCGFSILMSCVLS
jgi:hypothetical protein